MKVLSNTSPYWLDDPRVARAERDALAHIITGRDPEVIGLCPMTPIPVPEPAMMAADADGLGGLMLTPFPYLPRGITARYAMETSDAYRLRVVHALHALGAIGSEDGRPVLEPVPAPPTTSDEITARARRFDMELDAEPGFDATAMAYRRRLDAVWPDGYPLDGLLGMWHDLAPVIRGGCAVLAAHRALATGGVDDAQAVDLLREIRRDYPLEFDVKDMTPDGVTEWWRANADVVDVMADALVRLGFADETDANVIREVAHEPRA